MEEYRQGLADYPLMISLSASPSPGRCDQLTTPVRGLLDMLTVSTHESLYNIMALKSRVVTLIRVSNALFYHHVA